MTFYSLPELTPAYENQKIKSCNWIGGIDLNESIGEGENDGPLRQTVLVSLNKVLKAVRIGDDARIVQVRNPISSPLSAFFRFTFIDKF